MKFVLVLILFTESACFIVVKFKAHKNIREELMRTLSHEEVKEFTIRGRGRNGRQERKG